MVGYYPENIDEMLTLLNEHRDATIFAGGTDLMVVKRFSEKVIFVGKIDELQEICEEDGYICFGSGLTYSELIESDVPQIMKTVFSQVASPAIRNRGTIGGNICNASPAGDTLPMWYALGALVELKSISDEGAVISRVVPIREFILGIRKIDRKENELLTRILIPMENLENGQFHYFKKVGARRSEAISKLSFFGTAKIQKGIITNASVAFGAVGVTVVCDEAVSNLLQGLDKRQLMEKEEEVIAVAMTSVKPIDDQRSTAAYRKQVAKNLLCDFIQQVKENM